MAEEMETTGIAEEDRKLFIGGLPQEASDADLKEYFATFGEIETLSLKTDPISGRSRGFAFIIYKDPSSIAAATENESHVIKVSYNGQTRYFTHFNNLLSLRRRKILVL